MWAQSLLRRGGSLLRRAFREEGGFSLPELLVASSLLFTLDAASPIAPYLPTRYWLAFVDFFRDPILWRDITRGLALQGVYVGVLLAVAWANFSTKDVTS